MSKRIRGNILKTMFRDENSGYSIVSVRTEDSLLTLKGCLSVYSDNTPFTAEIAAVEGKDAYDILSFEETSDGITPARVESFLSSLDNSGTILSTKTIKGLMDRIGKGEELFTSASRTFSASNPEEQKLIDAKIRLPRLQRLFRETVAALLPPGEKPSYFLCNKYVRETMDFAMPYFRKNTCQICVSNLGIDFKTADGVRKRLTSVENDEDRIGALGMVILNKTEKSGSTCVSSADFITEVQETIYQQDGEAISQTRIEKALMYNNYIVNHSGYIAYGTSLHSEEMIQSNIKKLLSNRKQLFTLEELEKILADVEKKEGIQYAPAQKKAVQLLLNTGVACLTGGPGTGKTTVVNAIRLVFKTKYPQADIVMASPTGRAAQRMAEATKQEATTIHRLVGYGRNQRGKAQIPGDLVLIDESSMLDSEMAAWLLIAVSNNSLVLFIGDIDQLPSVGPGNVLKDLIQSGKIPVCRLETVYRQSGDSSIVVNANKINSGESDLRLDDSFIVHKTNDDKSILPLMNEVMQKALAETSDPVYGIQVLATSHKGDCSISAANKILQQMINPKKPGQKTLKFGAVEFRDGDKVILTNNNYEDNYFNGDIGVITNIDDGKVEITLSDKTVYVSRQNIRDMSLGYCISIHKSQGSEFEHAIILLPANPWIMLKRNLLYTAVTRAKKKCTVIASGNSISKCSKSIDNQKRDTMLSRLLLEL